MVVVGTDALLDSEDDDKNEKKVSPDATVPRRKDRFRKLRLKQLVQKRIGAYAVYRFLSIFLHAIKLH